MADRLILAIEENRLLSFAEEEPLKLEYFLSETESTWTPLEYAAAEGHIDQVIEALKSSGEKLTPEHFLTEDSTGATVVAIAASYHHLDQIFTPSVWAGRVGEMEKLWKQMLKNCPQETHFNYKALREEAMLQSRPPAQKWQTAAYAAAVPSSSLGANCDKKQDYKSLITK